MQFGATSMVLPGVNDMGEVGFDVRENTSPRCPSKKEISKVEAREHKRVVRRLTCA